MKILLLAFITAFICVAVADSSSTPVKILSGEKGMRARLDFYDMESPANQTLSVILTDTLDQLIENATVNLSITNTTGKTAYFVLSQAGTGNYSLNYSLESIGYYNISVNITREGFPGISGMKRIYVGYVEFSDFSNEESAFQNTVAYFRLTARNLGSTSSQVIPVINIFDSGGTLIFSRTGVSTTIQGNKTVSLLQYNILTFNVGTTTAGNYRVTAYLIFTDGNNQTRFTPNRTSTLRIISTAAEAAPVTTPGGAPVSTPGGAETPSAATSTQIESFSPERYNAIEIDDKNIAVKEIVLEVNREVSNAEIRVSRFESLPIGVASTEGRVYQYIEIRYSRLKNEDIKEAKIKFTVTKKWLSDNSITKRKVVLKRYSIGWTKLKTKLLKEDDAQITYEAESPGLSLFAIAEDTERIEVSVQFISVPKLVEAFPGVQEIETIAVLNPSDEPMRNIVASIEGIPSEWFSIVDNAFSLEPGEDKTIVILLSIPPNAMPGNYQARFNLYNGDISRDAFFIIRINSKEQIAQANAAILKYAAINEYEKETHFIIKIENYEKPQESLKIIENVDKSIASNINEIVFSQPPSRIIQADPIVEFTFTDLKPFEKRNVTYYVKKVVNVSAPFIYSSIQQIISMEKLPEIAGEVYRISVPVIAVLLIIIIVVLVIAVLLYIRRKRKERREIKEIEKIVVRVES